MSNAFVAEDQALDSLVARVADEFRDRQSRGERPDIEEYAVRHPHAAALLRKVLGALELIGLSLPDSSLEPVASLEHGLGTLGDFRIVRELGRGGMGIVYEAEQVSLRRRVALKVLPFAGSLDARRLQRFQNEAQAAASLHHTNIVPVYGVGCERAVHFYAMQYIDGHSLAAVLHELRQHAGLAGDDEDEPAEPPARPTPLAQPGGDQARTAPYLPPAAAPAKPTAETTPRAGLSTEQSIQSRAYFRTVAELGIQAAEALEHAHETGVVHRDIKPANLLLDQRGKLWVTDFGLAQCQHHAGLTMTGDLLGTLRYMSPEQALAQRAGIDHRTDLYSLGATLYELLTLRPVFGGRNRQELLRQIAFEEPRPPRQHNRTIPVELETIVLKALEKNPADRYPTAQELAADLRRFLDDQPIRARRPSLMQRARKWGLRNQPVVWSAAVIALILAASLGWITRDWRARRMEVESRVVEALAIAEPKLREGNPHDPQLVAAARTAEAQLTSDVVRAELRQQVKQLLVDLAMLTRLEEIQLDQAAANRDGFDIAGADAAYAEAFREYGIDVLGRSGPEAAAQIRQRAIGLHLAVALDNWAYARQKAQGEGWKRLLEVAQEADPDPWRCALREARAKESKADLEKLAASVPLPELSPTTLSVFGLVLQRAGAVGLAEKVLREGQLLHPDDFWINQCLAYSLSTDAKSQDAKSPQLEETIGFYRAALALRPRSPVIHTNLGQLHRRKGEFDKAIAYYREAIRLNKDYAGGHEGLGLALLSQGKLDEAVACCREAVRLSKDDARNHDSLGVALARQGKPDEAVACYREAIRLDKDYPTARYNIGGVLLVQGKLDEAADWFREAIRLRKDYA
jgi:serine/threonine protein kinase/Flp pilus assembly protein TadD